MANSDGFPRMSQKINKTKILPLRWIGNICGEFAGNHLVKCFDYDEDGKYGFAYKYHAKMWKYLNKPYTWWGTYYILDILSNDPVLDRLGSDYDEDGIPYWEKLTDSDSLES